MQLRFSLRAIFAAITAIAVACTVLFVVPEYVRLTILFAGVVAMPAPLAILARYGAPEIRAMGLGGIVAYVAWLVLAGIPAGILVANHLDDYVGISLTNYATSIRPGAPAGFGGVLIPSYLVHSGLYLPWIAVPTASLISLLCHLFYTPARGTPG